MRGTTQDHMRSRTTRRRFLGIVAAALTWPQGPAIAQEDGLGRRNRGGRGGHRQKDDEEYLLPAELTAFGALSLVLGRPSDRSVTVSTLAKETMEGYFQCGMASGGYDRRSDVLVLPAGKPVESVFDNLQQNTEYFYRLHYRKPGESTFNARPECRFHTQRNAGSTFSFGVQGDSHPERPQMNDPQLYARTLLNAASGHPDFYICMGDDFSVDTLRRINADTVAERYALQRPFLGLVGQSSPLFLVNGNHEQASLFNFNQRDVRHDVAVWAQNARNRYFPMPAQDDFYSRDGASLARIGSLRDYYAWTWGDALFVILDCYWNSPALVDNGFREGAVNARRAAMDIESETGGELHLAMRNTIGSNRRLSEASRSTSSSSPIMCWGQAVAASRNRTSMNGVAKTSMAIGNSTSGGQIGSCPFIN